MRIVRLVMVLFVVGVMVGPLLDAQTMDMGNGGMAGMGGMATTAPANNGGGFLANLFEVYMPRSWCMYNEPDVIWLHLISDSVIAISYFTIPVALLYFIKKRKDLAFDWMFFAFAVFILACGTTHIFNIIAIWHPYYRLDGVVKAVTAIASIVTAITLWPLIPKALAIPNIDAMKTANLELQGMRDALERRVQERTVDLEKANVELREHVAVRNLGEAARSRLAAIVESSTDAIIGKSLDGTITDWNLGAETVFGYRAEEIVGKSILTIVPVERRMEEPLIDEKLLRGERVESYETTRMRKDGKLLQISLTASPIRDYAGKIVGASKIVRDITEKKRAEVEREHLLSSEQRARAEAENASRVKDEFVATLSHELRTPVNAVLGWTRVLRSPHVTAEDMRDGMEVIERNTRVQVQLIEDLLDMSRILAGKVRLQMARVDMRDVVKASVETVLPAAAAKGIEIVQTVGTVPEFVMGDANRLQQIVWNLLSNAVKFTPRGGRVEVRLGRRESNLEIEVKDTGMGIKADFLPHVFERFRQADSSTTRQHGGLGLGLAIVRHLVELHGGSVQVKSDGEGKGTSFVVLLPVPVVHGLRGENEMAMEGAGGEAGILSLQGLKVLVVDDEADSRVLVKRLLEEFGAKVVVAASAAEGYELIGREKPQVIVSDIGMPVEDGYAFIRRVRLRSEADGGKTPAIALTAFARAEDKGRALLAGFQMHIGKPVEPPELIAMIASAAGLGGKGKG